MLRSLIVSRGQAVLPRARHVARSRSLLPTIVLVVVGSSSASEPDPALGGRRCIDIFVPSLVVMTAGDPRHQHAAGPPREVPREGRAAPAVDDAGQPAVPADRPARRQHGRGGRRASSCCSSSATWRSRSRCPRTRSASPSRSCSACRRCSRSACWSRRWRPSAGVASALFVPLFVARDVPRWGIPAADDAARAPDPDRRLHAARASRPCSTPGRGRRRSSPSWRSWP